MRRGNVVRMPNRGAVPLQQLDDLLGDPGQAPMALHREMTTLARQGKVPVMRVQKALHKRLPPPAGGVP